jgi:chromosome segregation ATPase
MLILEQEREHEEAQKATTEALAVLHELELLETGDEEEENDDDELAKLRQECVELTERLGDVEKEFSATKKRERVTNKAYASEISDLRLELKSERDHRKRLEDEIRQLKGSSTGKSDLLTSERDHRKRLEDEIRILKTSSKEKEDLHLELKSERDHRRRLEDEVGKLRVRLNDVVKKKEIVAVESTEKTTERKEEEKKITVPTITVPTQVKLKEEDILDEEELQNRIAEKEVELAIASGVRSITRFFW